MANNGAAVTISDGSLDFSGGVDSIKVTTIQSPSNPGGLARNELSWLNNATVRDAGILQRTGWKILGTIIKSPNYLYQGGFMYEPLGANPYLVLSISGNIWIVFPDFTQPPINLSAQFVLSNPPTLPRAYFVQAEEFLVIQAGDFGFTATPTLPLFWDGQNLTRSVGITSTTVTPGTPGINQIPAATVMDYYQGRIWYAQGRQTNAGDIVYGTAGTGKYNFRDAVLNVTENPLVVGGDGFMIPTQAGNIRALKHSANVDTTFGQGQLFIFTRKQVFSLSVPISRTAWIAANNNNQPNQNVVQLVNGSVNDTAVVSVNGDLYYQSLEPSIRSLILAVRYFNQPGNQSISANENRILQFNNRALMFACSGIEFDNRLWETQLPVQVAQGVIHQAIAPLDFTPISTFVQNLKPVWEGMYEGLDIFQMFTGDFGGLQRAFILDRSRNDQSLGLWEATTSDRSDTNLLGSNRVTWQIETPAYTWGQEFKLKRLTSGELWIDKIFGQIVILVEYRPDSSPCWLPWTEFTECVERNCTESVTNPCTYPAGDFREGYKQTVTFPKPPTNCASLTGRPSNIGYQFQVRLTIKGWCRVRGLLLHAEPVDRQLYANIVC